MHRTALHLTALSQNTTALRSTHCNSTACRRRPAHRLLQLVYDEVVDGHEEQNHGKEEGARIHGDEDDENSEALHRINE